MEGQEEYHKHFTAMNSMGGFREGEIDGKSFLIYTLLSQTAIDDSGGDNYILQPLFICPHFRLKFEMWKRNENRIFPLQFLPFSTPHLVNAEQEIQYKLGSDSCKLPILPLFWCNNKQLDGDDEESNREFRCGACRSSKLGTYYYFCVTCRGSFHKECVESPLEIKHPSYPFQNLQFYGPVQDFMDCSYCETSLFLLFYHCPTYKLSMHPACAMKPIPIVIEHPKRHPHPLTFFPKQVFLPCDICGLVKESIPTYVCVQCVFVVHRNCVYVPNVIKISRHHHRISFTYSLPSGKLFCRVCRKKVDNHYGAYGCSKCNDCFIHTRCALRRDVWDGVELEGIPEELDDVDIEPFERIAEGIILHFSHDHLLKLEISMVYEESKYCEACVLPIYGGNYYSCTDQCGFILHETCANAPRRKQHALHPHPLTLTVVTYDYNAFVGYFSCDGCKRQSCGFIYECPRKECGFKLDVQCALVSEPFEYQDHEHPLFLALKPEEERLAKCKICQEDSDGNNWYRKLNCIECDCIICFRCATLPYKARYKHDKHFLTFRKGKEAIDHSDWCKEEWYIQKKVDSTRAMTAAPLFILIVYLEKTHI